jgi:hypothetical protein
MLISPWFHNKHNFSMFVCIAHSYFFFHLLLPEIRKPKAKHSSWDNNFNKFQMGNFFAPDYRCLMYNFLNYLWPNCCCVELGNRPSTMQFQNEGQFNISPKPVLCARHTNKAQELLGPTILKCYDAHIFFDSWKTYDTIHSRQEFMKTFSALIHIQDLKRR